MGGIGFGFQCCGCMLLNSVFGYDYANDEWSEDWEKLSGTWDGGTNNGCSTWNPYAVLRHAKHFGGEFFIDLSHDQAGTMQYRVLLGVEDKDNYWACEVRCPAVAGQTSGWARAIHVEDGNETELDKIDCIIQSGQSVFWGFNHNHIRVWVTDHDRGSENDDGMSDVYFCWYNRMSVSEGYRKMHFQVPRDIVGRIGVGTGTGDEGYLGKNKFIFSHLYVQRNNYKCDTCHSFDYGAYGLPEIPTAAKYQVTIAGVPDACDLFDNWYNYGPVSGDYLLDHYMNGYWYTWRDNIGHVGLFTKYYPEANKLGLSVQVFGGGDGGPFTNGVFLGSSRGMWAGTIDLNADTDLSTLDITLEYTGVFSGYPQTCEGIQQSTAHITAS